MTRIGGYVSPERKAANKARLEDAGQQHKSWKKQQQSDRQKAKGKANQRAKEKAARDAGSRPDRNNYKDKKQYKADSRAYNEQRRSNYAEYEQQKRSDKKAKRQNQQDSRKWIQDNSLPGGYGSMAGDEYRVQHKMDKFSDPRFTQKYQEKIIRNQAGKRAKDQERWDLQKQDPNYDPSNDTNAAYKAKQHHWNKGSMAAYEAYQNRKPGEQINYRDYYSSEDIPSRMKERGPQGQKEYGPKSGSNPRPQPAPGGGGGGTTAAVGEKGGGKRPENKMVDPIATTQACSETGCNQKPPSNGGAGQVSTMAYPEGGSGGKSSPTTFNMGGPGGEQYDFSKSQMYMDQLNNNNAYNSYTQHFASGIKRHKTFDDL